MKAARKASKPLRATGVPESDKMIERYNTRNNMSVDKLPTGSGLLDKAAKAKKKHKQMLENY